MKRMSLTLTPEALFKQAVKGTLLAVAGIGTAAAQQAAPAAGSTELEKIEVTGTRISAPGIVSSSPVYSIDASELSLQQNPEMEQVFRLLPITLPSDGANVNNGTAGTATINLRGLGSQRTLVLLDGKRLTPYDINGRIDTSMIPLSIVERIDIITGGASAVYGSDAMAGAINIITKRDFQGVDAGYNFSTTGDKDGDIRSAYALMGGNFVDGRGNAVLSLNWADRQGVQLGARPLGKFGIATVDGAGYDAFLNGQSPTAAPAGCGGPNTVAANQSGSTTTIPTRVAIAGSAGIGQFHDDGTIGANCSRFNFNPYNYYQTPQEKFGGSVVGHFSITNNIEAYSRITYGETRVTQQVAPSGIFGDAFFTPLSNPLIGSAARATLIARGEVGRGAGTLCSGGACTFENWHDNDNSGTVTAADDLLISYRRRTEELGPRSTSFDNTNYQFVMGTRADVLDTFKLDLSYQRGHSERITLNQGYTNVAHIADQVNSTDGVTCAASSDPSCVPINLFGGFGSITPAAAAYAQASALDKGTYTQHILSSVISGSIPGAQVPTASQPLAVSVGAERRREKGDDLPDECLKLAPASCLGGAGGNSLPVAGGFSVSEVFAEGILPLADNMVGAKSFDLELGVRRSNYNPTGVNTTYKAGFNWSPIDMLMVRVMQQRAARAPNVGELAAPQVASLQNANQDPCSIANATALASDATLRARCISTGMTAPQVGTVEDIVAGQVNTFSGTDLASLPKPEKGDSFTAGFVVTPKVPGLRTASMTFDYYDIKIKDYIGTYAPQEILDACYVAGQASQCAKIRRVGGELALPGSGIETFTTNLNYLQARGIEVGFNVGLGLGELGGLKFTGDYNHYLKQESQSSDSSVVTPVIDCLGYYGTSCGNPLPVDRWIQRTTWDWNLLEVSYLWRHLGEAEREKPEVGGSIPQFTRIAPYDYLDLSASYKVYGDMRLSIVARNVLDKDPPVVGDTAATTSANSGNTFPSVYDTLGRVYVFGVDAKF